MGVLLAEGVEAPKVSKINYSSLPCSTIASLKIRKKQARRSANASGLF
jgi:hypothetical protein